MATNGSSVQMVRTTMAIPIDISSGQIAKINLPPGATLAGPVKVLTLPNSQTVAHVTVMAPPGIVEKYVAAQAAAATSTVVEGYAPQITNPNVGESRPPPTTSSTSKDEPDSVKQEPANEPSRNLFEKLSANKSSSSKESSPSPQSPAIPSIQPPLKQENKTSSAVVDNEDEDTAGKLQTKKAKLPSSSDDDGVPLSKLNSKKDSIEDDDMPKVKKKMKKPLEKEKEKIKKKPSKEIDKDLKPTTGYGLFFAEIVPTLKKENPGLNFTDVSKMISKMWSDMDSRAKKEWTINAYPLLEKKSSSSSSSSSKDSKDTVTEEERIRLKRLKIKKIKARQAQAEAHTESKQREKKKHTSDETPSGGRVDHPKRNVKRKTFHNISEELDSDDTDWVMPVPKKLDSTLKFKKKTSAQDDDYELPSVLADETIPPPPSLKPQPKHETTKSATNATPPPLRKVTPTNDTETADNDLHVSSKFRPICLKEGCYEHAASSDVRGRYWCSDHCCVDYCNLIFNAWVSARKANMIECL